MSSGIILVIEDDEEIARLVQQTLQKEGYQADWADNGQTGWDKVSQNSYDLIILDLML
jgi:DNA-binding response OmpR family regulator